MAQQFDTVLWASGGRNVAIVVPDEVVEAFGRGRRVPVVVTVDGGYTYRTTVAAMGGRFLVSFNAETRAATGRTAGDAVAVRLEVDDAPRTVEVPDALAAVLVQDQAAADAWRRLSYSRQKALADPVAGAKTDATRERRLSAALEALR